MLIVYSEPKQLIVTELDCVLICNSPCVHGTQLLCCWLADIRASGGSLGFGAITYVYGETTTRTIGLSIKLELNLSPSERSAVRPPLELDWTTWTKQII